MDIGSNVNGSQRQCAVAGVLDAHAEKTSDDQGYYAWNAMLLRHFFVPENAGRQVYLYATKAVIEHAGSQCGMTFEHFIATLKAGPPEAGDEIGVCSKALRISNNWRLRSAEPPYFAYLILFALAANSDDKAVKFSPNAYYPRLRSLLGESGKGIYPGMPATPALWHDLEGWTQSDMLGRLGIFTAQRRGYWPYVSYPFAQIVLSQDERKGIIAAFDTAHISDDEPSDSVLATIVEASMRNTLRPATRAALREAMLGSKGEATIAVMEAVRAEFVEWFAQHSDESQLATSTGRLYVTLAIDRVSDTVKCALRAKLPSGFPPETLEITDQTGLCLMADEQTKEWSAKLADEHGAQFNSCSIDWRRTRTFRDAENLIACKFPKRTVRWFASGLGIGLSDYVEVDMVPSTGSVILLADSDDPYAKVVASWAQLSFAITRKLAVHGLPAGWECFECHNIIAGAFAGAPGVRIEETKPHVSFIGGIGAGDARTFLAIAPPEFTISDGDPFMVTVNDLTILPSDLGIYMIPDSVVGAETLAIVCLLSDGRIVEASLRLVHHSAVAETIRPHWTDQFGRPRTKDMIAVAVSGALTIPIEPPPLAILRYTFRGQLYLLGPNPGDLASLDADLRTPPFPLAWFYAKTDGCLLRLSDLPPTAARRSNFDAMMRWKAIICDQTLHTDSVRSFQALKKYRIVADGL